MNRQLPVKQVEKPWGRTALPHPFTSKDGARIGEIWFEPPPELSALLVKYIFTSEALSVQVHPTDRQTEAAGLGRQGKEECWLIIDAEPGAKLGIGTKEPADTATLHKAALDGSIEQLLEWHDVVAGDFFYIPANTIHAIGAGISLIEVQQNSDITYRLYDYGRPRELHLAEGLAVSIGLPYPETLRKHLKPNQEVALVEGPLFRLSQLCGPPSPDILERYAKGPLLAVPTSQDVLINEVPVKPGNCALVSDIHTLRVPAGSTCLIAQPVASVS